jgi:DNA-binding winged helix-turn-helix (wHTH) protein
MQVRFEDCLFDPETHEVLRSGRPVPLSPKAFHLLEILIRERPKAIDHRKLHGELWPGIFVTDANLPNLVAELRSALGDDARSPHLIRTVRGFGYAFSASARAVPAAGAAPSEGPVYRLIWGNREIALVPGENGIGRAADSTLWIDDSAVSRHHARIVIDDSSAVIEDLGSKNGTFVRGKRISGKRRLADEDPIQIGPANLIFRIFRQTGSTASKSR